MGITQTFLLDDWVVKMTTPKKKKKKKKKPC
jgi:hypothetical protein